MSTTREGHLRDLLLDLSIGCLRDWVIGSIRGQIMHLIRGLSKDPSIHKSRRGLNMLFLGRTCLSTLLLRTETTENTPLHSIKERFLLNNHKTNKFHREKIHQYNKKVKRRVKNQKEFAFMK